MNNNLNEIIGLVGGFVMAGAIGAGTNWYFGVTLMGLVLVIFSLRERIRGPKF